MLEIPLLRIVNKPLNMSRKIIKSYNRIIAFFLSVLGFSASCRHIIERPDEYGVPHATYIVNGTVISKTGNLPIPKIKAVAGKDTILTDADGKFRFDGTQIQTNFALTIQLIDIDGTANGTYSETDTTIIFTSSDFSGGSSWDEGTAEKTIEVKMKPKP
jgi:putative lipoprotein (rSAM/lipoprotein system)